jgi:hypothetical protein
MSDLTECIRVYRRKSRQTCRQPCPNGEKSEQLHGSINLTSDSVWLTGGGGIVSPPNASTPPSLVLTTPCKTILNTIRTFALSLFATTKPRLPVLRSCSSANTTTTLWACCRAAAGLMFLGALVPVTATVRILRASQF